MLQYDTVEQAQMRLQGSVITYKDKAILVRRVRAGAGGVMMIEADTYPVGGKIAKDKGITVAANDLDLNYRIFRLGYMNDDSNKIASYLIRQGRRQQVQGLTAATIGGFADPASMYRQGFEDMLFDKYPKPSSAMTMLQDGWLSVAISRDFAIGADKDFKKLNKLYYRNIPVGVTMGDAAFSLADEYKFLAEVTKEHNIPFTLE